MLRATRILRQAPRGTTVVLRVYPRGTAGWNGSGVPHGLSPGLWDATEAGSRLQRNGPMASYGYARVSTTDQDLAGQREALERAGCTVIREETASGSSMAARGELRTVLDFIGAGDELVVTRVDRLARSIGDLQDVVHELRAKGASLRCTEQPVDTSSAAGKAFLDMLGGVRGVRDGAAARASDGGHRAGEGCGQVQGPQARGGPREGARTAGPGGAAVRDRAAAEGGAHDRVAGAQQSECMMRLNLFPTAVHPIDLKRGRLPLPQSGIIREACSSNVRAG